MSRTLLPWLIVLSLSGSAVAAPTKEEAADDHKWLVETWKKHEKAFGAVKYLTAGGADRPLVQFGGDATLVSKLVEVETVNADLKGIVERLDAIKARYGTDAPASVSLRISRAEQGLAVEAAKASKGWTTNRAERTARYLDKEVKDKEEAKKRAARAVIDELTKEGAFTVPEAKTDEVVTAITSNFSKETFSKQKGGAHQYAAVYNARTVVAAVEQVLGVTSEGPEPKVAADPALATAHEGLKKGAAELLAKRKEVADALVHQADAYLKKNAWVYYGMVEKQLALAARVNPADEALKARVAGFAEEVKKHKADRGPEIDKREWPKNKEGFAGPGSADELAAKGLAFIKAGGDQVQFRLPSVDSKTYAKGKVLAVTVQENWEVVKEVLGKVTIWGLACYVVVTDEEMEKDGVAAAYLFRLHPAEGSDRGTPWANAYDKGDTGNPPHFYVRLSKKPK